MLDRQSYFFQNGAWVYTLDGILLTCGYILVIIIINHFYLVVEYSRLELAFPFDTIV